MPKILLVDDEPNIRHVVRFALEKEGFAVIEAEDGVQGLTLARTEAPHLILLDIAMPEMDGLEFCRALRRDMPIPIIFVTSRDEEIDRILGLEMGGDDYVTKPFSPRELVSRVKAVLRRVTPLPASPPAPAIGVGQRIDHGALVLDIDRYQASWQGKEVILTATEFALLRTLAERPGKVFTRHALMDGAYGIGHYVSDRTVDSHVRRIRAKFEAAGGVPVETVHGVGYRLSECR